MDVKVLYICTACDNWTTYDQAVRKGGGSSDADDEAADVQGDEVLHEGDPEPPSNKQHAADAERKFAAEPKNKRHVMKTLLVSSNHSEIEVANSDSIGFVVTTATLLLQND